MRIAYLGAHTSVHTRRWVSYFASRGHEVHLLSCGVDAGQHDDDVVVHDLGAPWPPKVGYLRRIRAARQHLHSLRPDLVHAHFATSYGMIAVGAGVRPLVVTAHGDDVLLAPRNPAKRIVVRRVLRHADLVTVPAAHMRDAVDRLQGGAGAPVLVFQYGVETARLIELADAARAFDAASTTRPLRIVSARPLLPLYRIEVLIDALALLQSEGVAFSCEVFGDGPQRGELSARAVRAGLAGVVTFAGSVPSPVVEKSLARADVAVSLASSDGASLAVIEAMALGATLVLSDIPGNRAWATAEGAVLVAPHAKAVAEGIVRAASLDSASAARSNRRVVLEQCDLATNLGRFERVMEALHDGTELTEVMS